MRCSLTGAGGNSATHFYSWSFTPDHKKNYPKIHQLEALNILIAIRTPSKPLALEGKGLLVHTDNMSSSYALMMGKTRDQILGACACEIWLEGALNNIEIKIVHKPGCLIPLADALSRASTDSVKNEYIRQEVARRNLQELTPVLNGYRFFSDRL